MTRYSDPYVCPDCHSRLPAGSVSCPTCALPVQGPLAVQLFHTLRQADELVAQLRASVLAPALVPSVPAAMPHVPVATRPTPRPPVERSGIRVASVPSILLGLGALCLLVAAVTFLAVAWSWLGVGGRTAVLVVLTVATGGTGTWLGSRGLRVSAESLTSVGLGLLVLDVVGADNAGWLGDLSLAGGVCLVGGVLATASLALTLSSTRLVVPQLGAVIGLWLLVAGAVEVTGHEHLVFGAGVLAFAALAGVGRARGTVVTTWAAFAGGWTWWAVLALSGLAEAIDHASLRELWAQGHGWSLLAASMFLLVPIAFASSREWVVQLSAGMAATAITFVVALPAMDEDLTTLTVVALVCLVAWSVGSAVVPARLALAPLGPIALAALPVVLVSVGLLVQGASTVLDVGDPFTLGAGVRLHPIDTVADPALLVPSALALLIAGAVFVSRTERPSRPATALAATGAVTVGALGTLALHPVPLWTVTASLAVVASLLMLDAHRREGSRSTTGAAAGVAVAVAALVTALPSDWLTAGAALLLTAGAGYLTTTGRTSDSRLLGRALLPMSAATLLWSAANVADVSEAHRAVPVLLVVGLLAIILPRAEVELSAAAAAVVASLLAIESSADQAGSLALHLTVAGALVTASALINPERRLLGWLGGALLALATWVRLIDLGVGTPEAYTLPSAVALVLLGLHRLWRDPQASTALALGPALTLATTPSLLWVIADDPVSARATLLGGACLALVLAGTRLHWNAPLAVGSAVGGLLVLRELAPYAAQTPQWVLIGLAGTLLTVVGVTWESRLRDLQQAATYLGRLR
ncbi:hypothetical protein [Nocardioides sp.]|uniref:SCO7613 C-terminal domain-containing membrane protein n=1 Tax=Nocardioides sp. TaxID=35761 RepID=UPI0031FF28D4|nr:hypothetical protein [Nocardioides sp.]